MNILTKLFKRKKAKPEVIINHIELGEIKYDHNDGWNSILSFNNENIEVYIWADINGPTETQIEIWKNIKDNINSLNNTSISEIRKDLKENNWPSEYLTNELTLAGIFIYHDKKHSDSHFELSYFLNGDDEGTHRVDYKDLKPLYCGRDD